MNQGWHDVSCKHNRFLGIWIRTHKIYQHASKYRLENSIYFVHASVCWLVSSMHFCSIWGYLLPMCFLPVATRHCQFGLPVADRMPANHLFAWKVLHYSLAPRRRGLYHLERIIFKPISGLNILIALSICPRVNITRHCWWLVCIGSGNGLVPTGNKPLPEPMLTQNYVAIWRH